MPVKCCKPDSQWRLYNDDNYEMAESGIALVRIVQCTARKILLLTGESLLWERSSIGRAAVRTIKQGEQDWRSNRHASIGDYLAIK